MKTNTVLIDDPHAQHCCLAHGCRFNNNDRCTVVKGTIAQINKCGESSICSEYRAGVDDEYDDCQYQE